MTYLKKKLQIAGDRAQRLNDFPPPPASSVKLSWQLHSAVAVCAPHLAAGWWTRLFSLFRFTLILVQSVRCKAKQWNNTEMLVFISFQLKNSFTAEWRRPYILSVNKCIQLETFSHWESHFTQMFFCTDCDLSEWEQTPLRKTKLSTKLPKEM